MKLNNENAVIYIPDNKEEGYKRTTDLCISAHQDDIEIMSYGPTVKCYQKDDLWFSGMVVTDGAGSPRTGEYLKYTDEDMKKVRIEEQKTAALIGGYASQFLLGYSSKEVKTPGDEEIIEEIKNVIMECSPERLYTHNLADKHDTHVAVALRVIEAVRRIPKDKRPKEIYSLEVWRSLDWLCDEDKIIFDTSKHPNLAAALLGVYDSQIAGGKRYDSAAISRRLANATFFESHGVDDIESMNFGLNITELVNDETVEPKDFIVKYIEKFKLEVEDRLERLS